MSRVPGSDEFQARFNDLCWNDVGQDIFTSAGLTIKGLTRSEHGENIVLLADGRYVLKIYRPARRGFEREGLALQKLAGKLPVALPEIIAKGKVGEFDYLLTTSLPGRLVSRAEWLMLDRDLQFAIAHQLADLLKAIHSVNAADIKFDWPGFVAKNAAGAVERQRSEGGNPEWVESLPAYIERNLPLVNTAMPPVFLHGDVHFGNLHIVEHDGMPRIAGIFDFADSLCGSHEYDFIAVGVLMLQGQGELQREFLRSYGYADASINEEMRRRMMMLTVLYETSSLRRYAERLSPEAVNFTLEELERAIWAFA